MVEGGAGRWEVWVEEALSKLDSLKLLRSLRPIHLPLPLSDDLQVFDRLMPWDRSSVEINVSHLTFRLWLDDIPSSGDDIKLEAGTGIAEASSPGFQKLLLFSSNDYLGLSSHPTIAKSAALAAHEHGMGPRGSALICGYTNYHRHLESSLAELKAKEDLQPIWL